MKKFLSVLLSALIVAASVPVATTAFAAETGETASGAKKQVVKTAATEPVTQPATEAPTEAPTEPVPAKTYTPATPTTVRVSKTTVSKVGLKWNRCKYASKYWIFRSDEKEDGTFTEYKKVATIHGIENTSFVDTNLKDGTIYKYRVYAYRLAKGVTTHSGYKGATVMTPPKAVSSLKVTARDSVSITFEWTKNPKATEYRIYRAIEKSDGSFTHFKLLKAIEGKYRGYKNSGLAAGKFYKYKVYVFRKHGTLKGLSNYKVVKGITKLKAPKSFKVKNESYNSVKIAWSKVGRATHYEIYRKSPSAGFVKIDEVTGQKYTDDNLTPGTTYTYKVRGIRKYNTHRYAGAFAVVKASTIIQDVGNLRAKSYLRHALLSWDYVSSADGYDIFVQASNGEFNKIDSTPYRNFLTPKYTAGKTYTFMVRPYTYSGDEKVYGSASTKSVTIVGGAYGYSEPTGTWVEVCTEAQVLKMYVNGKGYISTPVVTGMKNSQDTTPGYHTVIQRSSPARLVGSANGHSWDVPVTYWLGFTGDGQGIHDATWRTSGYGGEIYDGDGSNGCVNTPYDAVAKIYAKSYMGMPVIVF